MEKVVKIIFSLSLIVHAIQSSDQKTVQHISEKRDSSFGVKIITDYDEMLPQFLKNLSLPGTTTVEELKIVLNQRRNMTIGEQIEKLNERFKSNPQTRLCIQKSYNQVWVEWAKDSVQIVIENPKATLEQLNTALTKEMKLYPYFCIQFSVYKKMIQEENFVDSRIMQRILAFILLEKLNRFSSPIFAHQLHFEQLEEYQSVSMHLLLNFNPDEEK